MGGCTSVCLFEGGRFDAMPKEEKFRFETSPCRNIFIAQDYEQLVTKENEAAVKAKLNPAPLPEGMSQLGALPPHTPPGQRMHKKHFDADHFMKHCLVHRLPMMPGTPTEVRNPTPLRPCQSAGALIAQGGDPKDGQRMSQLGALPPHTPLGQRMHPKHLDVSLASYHPPGMPLRSTVRSRGGKSACSSRPEPIVEYQEEPPASEAPSVPKERPRGKEARLQRLQ